MAFQVSLSELAKKSLVLSHPSPYYKLNIMETTLEAGDIFKDIGI